MTASNPRKAECCEAYRADCLKLIAEWRERGPSKFEDTEYAITETEKVLAGMDAGAPCPWHDKPEWGIDGWKNYLAVMELAKQPDFEQRLRDSPIRVIPK